MHRLATPLVLLALVLAGCAEEAAPSATPAGTPGAAPAAGAEDADAVPVVDPGSAPHVHDLWDGRERITLLEQDYTVEPPEAAMWVFMSTLFLGEPSAGGFFVELPEGQLVPEGTGRVEVTATWSDPTVSGLRFLYRHAGSGDIEGWVKAPQDEAALIEVTPEMSDMPHTQRTRWIFAFLADGAPPTAVGTVHLRMDAVRTRDPSVYPGHPDLWKGATELLRLDSDGKTTTEAVDSPFPEPGQALTPPADALILDAPVPMETATLVVRVDVQSVEPPGTTLKGLRLDYRTAADMEFDFDEVEVKPEIDGQTYVWRIPVKMEHTDSAYAEGSAWAILVQPEVEPPVPGPLPCQCKEVTLRYHARVSALRLPEAAPAAAPQAA